jgi:hypothetical protein
MAASILTRLSRLGVKVKRYRDYEARLPGTFIEP